jgi:hypothetical protein
MMADYVNPMHILVSFLFYDMPLISKTGVSNNMAINLLSLPHLSA